MVHSFNHTEKTPNTRRGGVLARIHPLHFGLRARFILFSMFSLGTFNSTQAQFINPTTNDDFAGCTVPNVENTGTASWGDLQVIVVDGDEPSIVFVDHSTSPATTQCFYLEAFNQGFSVTDPDVVWDYQGTGLLLVVYESDFQGMPGIWSEAWNWNAGAPFHETSYGAGGFYQYDVGGRHPNVDAAVNGHAVTVWENGGTISAMAYEFLTFTPTGAPFFVNDPLCGRTTGQEPDVAMRHLNGKTYVNFVYVEASIAADEIVVVMEDYFTVASGFSSMCVSHTVQHAGGLTPNLVRKPRIDMNTWFDTSSDPYYDPYDCSVVYGMENGGQHFIGSAQKKAASGQYIPHSGNPDWYCFLQTYSSPASVPNAWISDVMNSNVGTMSCPPCAGATNAQINPPPAPIDLRADPNNLPVTTIGGDEVTYVSWAWNDRRSIRFGLDELLSRRLMLHPNQDTIWSFTGIGLVAFIMAVPAPTLNDYFIVGEGFSTGENQTIISTDATLDHAYYAFYEPNSTRIGFKRSLINPASPVRQAPKPTDKQLAKSQAYPNPTHGPLNIQTKGSIEFIEVLNLNGQLVFQQGFSGAKDVNISLPEQLPQAMYFVLVRKANGSLDKILVQKW